MGRVYPGYIRHFDSNEYSVSPPGACSATRHAGPLLLSGGRGSLGAVLQGEVRLKDRDVMSANEELLGRPVPGCMLSEYYLLVVFLGC